MLLSHCHVVSFDIVSGLHEILMNFVASLPSQELETPTPLPASLLQQIASSSSASQDVNMTPPSQPALTSQGPRKITLGEWSARRRAERANRPASPPRMPDTSEHALPSGMS